MTWRHALPLLLLAVAIQAWAFAYDSTQDWFTEPLAMVTGFVLAGIALLLSLARALPAAAADRLLGRRHTRFLA